MTLVVLLDLEDAANTIIRWWRPFYARLVEIRKNRWVRISISLSLCLTLNPSPSSAISKCNHYSKKLARIQAPVHAATRYTRKATFCWKTNLQSQVQSQSCVGLFVAITHTHLNYLCPFRSQLLRISAAFVIQRAWRNTQQKRIRARKVKTKHLAATKIQAAWNGFWVRSHTSLRFSYGEVVFLVAVRRNLYNCHFIIKMYRPCGIVCPKSQ